MDNIILEKTYQNNFRNKDNIIILSIKLFQKKTYQNNFRNKDNLIILFIKLFQKNIPE